MLIADDFAVDNTVVFAVASFVMVDKSEDAYGTV